MNGKKDISLEQLALYQDQLLSDREQREVEQAVAEQPAYQDQLRELSAVQETLQEWGRKNRIYTSVISDMKRKPQGEEQKCHESVWIFPVNFQWAASMAVVLVLALTVFYSLSNHRSARTSLVEGVVQTEQSAIQVGTIIGSGKQIVLEPNSFVRLKMGDGKSTTELGPNTVATITGPRSLELKKGVAWTEVAKDPDHPYRILTPHGIVTVLGTRFEVEVTDVETKVSVKQGKVEISNDKSGSVQKTYLEKDQFGIIKENGVSEPRNLGDQKVAAWRQMGSSGSASPSTADMARVLSGQ